MMVLCGQCPRRLPAAALSRGWAGGAGWLSVSHPYPAWGCAHRGTMAMAQSGTLLPPCLVMHPNLCSQSLCRHFWRSCWCPCALPELLLLGGGTGELFGCALRAEQPHIPPRCSAVLSLGAALRGWDACSWAAGCSAQGGTDLLDPSLPQQWTSSINRANKMALLTWMRETGIDLVQVNGQRRYGGPPPGGCQRLGAVLPRAGRCSDICVPAGWVGSPPPPGSEVYIAKLPRDLYEDKLIPLFQSVGQLYEFRLMLTFSGLNRGFAYAKYSDQHSAGKAIAALNNWEVQEGRTILVCRSFEKCELSVNGLPATLRRGELGALLLEITEGLLGLTLHNSPDRKQGKVAMLTYCSHRAAAMAKKALVEGTGRQQGRWG